MTSRFIAGVRYTENGRDQSIPVKIWTLSSPFCEWWCHWTATGPAVLLPPVMGRGNWASTSGRWATGLSRRCRMFVDRAVPSTLIRSVQMRLVDQAAKPGDRPLLDDPQRLPLVFISSPSRFALHLFIRRLGASHYRRRWEFSIEISYFLLQQPISPIP